MCISGGPDYDVGGEFMDDDKNATAEEEGFQAPILKSRIYVYL
jgi:hypothetical protein